MEKRSLLAVALSAAVFIVYYGFFYKAPVKPKTTAAAPISTPATTPVANPTTVGTSAPAVTPTDTIPQAPETHHEMGSSVVQAELSSRSGLPMEWFLKKYFQQPGGKGANIDLLKAAGTQMPLGLLLFPGQGVVFPNLSPGASTDRSMDFQGQVGDISIQEKLEFIATDYTLQIQLRLENRGTAATSISPGLRLEVAQNPLTQRGFWIFKEAPNVKFPLYRLGTSVQRHRDVKKMGPLQEQSGDISWVGLEDHYFLSMILARNVSPQNRVAYGATEGSVFSQLQYGPEALAPGQSREYQFTLYLGPKEPALLKSFGEARLDQAVDYGWFSLIALPILQLLKWFHSFLGNWGLAIIALTLLIKLLLYPLTRKSMQSMKGMQALQPQLQKLREKYADNREQLNLQTMELFKRHKVNPMGGCLPMVIQMPIYIALYKVLYNATDLFHAPFFGFYHDLSAPDPYFILPVLLGIFMVLQQRMTPSTGDPSQAKMMMLMPVMFSLFMIFLPLGLVLYIFVNTVLTVVQQWMNQKDLSLGDLFKGKKSTA